ncbi:hypothetical protein [Capnocytophaga canimorsus]|uniref:Uncharacterized protein n=2 Tax=Capnocytophaga canimorsus TaxID=28188 RepID=F9YSM2_CAPCC|nr:hypothetical protein [Capnocytophaga canimorsus]AEK22695.1 Conserved hypothetical protein [Capnocytophaga canimorsus Cc5]GIM59901.1 hypothetical protein CAPN007_21100 [Capnocytophaga canimorsus]CEN50691.1 conserved hypothetical protein [Capnocytophaga canimorsus]
MNKNNLISTEFSSEEMKKIDDALNEIIEVLEKKAVNITPEERRQYGNVADYNKMFIEKAKANMEQAPDTLPTTINKADFDRDYKLSAQMAEPLRKVNRILEMLTDTRTLADMDNYVVSLLYYKYIKFLAAQHIPSAVTILAELRKHFKKASKEQNSGQETTQTTTPTEN